MKNKKNIDLAIAVLCALIIIVAMYGIGDDEGGVLIVLFATIGFVIFLYSYLTAVAKTRSYSKDAPEYEDASIIELLLLNEEDQPIASWDMFGKAALVIGRDVKENHVDINLSQSVYASLIDIEHAVLNYADNGWYIEDLGSQNGVVLQKAADGRKYKLSADQPCRLGKGDVIIIGLTKLKAR